MSHDTTGTKNWFARHKILSVLGGIILFFIIIGAASGGSSDTSSSNGSSGSNTDLQDAPVAYTLNDQVTVGDVKWVVTSATSKTSLAGAFGGTETTQGKFVVINVTVENLGKDMKSISNLKLVDSQGREFTSSSKSYKNLGADQLYILQNLNPNLPYTFADVYEVPADAEGFSVVVGDLAFFGSDEEKIGLGF
ncbi:MAG: DUF4352 domain-containing protein [Patescibacteria group bacterium]